MNIKLNNGVTLEVEKREYLFTLSDGVDIFAVNDGAGRLKFWFSTSGNIHEPAFDIRHYMSDGQEFYYENCRIGDAAKNEKNWHERVQIFLEKFFVPFFDITIILGDRINDGEVISFDILFTKKIDLPLCTSIAYDHWYNIENWLFICEYNNIKSDYIVALPSGQLWIHKSVINLAKNTSITAIKKDLAFREAKSKYLKILANFIRKFANIFLY